MTVRLLASMAANSPSDPIVVSMFPVPVSARFCNRTLQAALFLLDDVRWSQGVDEKAAVIGLINSLWADYMLIDSGLRDDDEIRERATATLRQLSAKFIRDDAYGLVDYADFDPAAIANPDHYDDISR